LSVNFRPFGPRMTAEIAGFTPSRDLKYRAREAFVADVWDVACAPEARGTYVSPDPRLFIPLELEGGGQVEIFESVGATAGQDVPAMTVTYIPAHQPQSVSVRGVTRMKHLDIHLNETALRRRFGRSLAREGLNRPRFRLDNPPLVSLAGLIAEEVEAESPHHDRFLDGLVDAFVAKLFDIPLTAERRRPALSDGQLRQTMAYIDAHCLETIRLSDLAGEVGLSETYFSHAFKAAVGVSPHRWVMQERVRRAQALLREGDEPVSWVAAQCGFADQAHFSRVFRSITGLTPGAWKREL